MSYKKIKEACEILDDAKVPTDERICIDSRNKPYLVAPNETIAKILSKKYGKSVDIYLSEKLPVEKVMPMKYRGKV